MEASILKEQVCYAVKILHVGAFMEQKRRYGGTTGDTYLEKASVHCSQDTTFGGIFGAKMALWRRSYVFLGVAKSSALQPRYCIWRHS